MIAKHVAMRSIGMSDFGGLVTYITDAQSKTERLGHVAITNCQAETPEAAITEIIATQGMNTRATGDKTYHLLISFRAGENPSAETLKEIEKRICAGLGFAEHQRVSAVHHDTDNLHIHLAINKIHPERLTMTEPYQSYRKLSDLCESMEREFGLQPDNHIATRSIEEGRAMDMEHHAGVQSLVGWIKRECLHELTKAQTWGELHQALHDNGLALIERGNGFVIESGNGTQTKASTVARDLSKPKLVERLGTFEPSPHARTRPKREYVKQPMRSRVDTTELYAKYKAAQASIEGTQKAALAAIKRKTKRRIEDAKRAGRLRRAAIKLMGDSGPNKRLLYAQASQALRSAIEAAHKDAQAARHACYDDNKRRAWADWLKAESLRGNDEALTALRAREAAKGLKGNTVAGRGAAQPGHAPVTDNITKKGTIILRGESAAVRDDGQRIQVSRAVTTEGMQEALRMTAARYGNRITVDGTAEFKARAVFAAVKSQQAITFADPELEARRQSLLKKEQANVERTGPDGAGRGIGRSIGSAGKRGGGTGRDAARSAGRTFKPNVSRVGSAPPPAKADRLRDVSELDVVRDADRSKVLLPSDVRNDVERERTKPVHNVRRDNNRAGRLSAKQAAAADKYIAEREAKRREGFDISEHLRYTNGMDSVKFAGVRNVDGESLALLKQGDKIGVLPVDSATAQRLTRLSIGDSVSVTEQGSIKTTTQGMRR